MMQNYPSAEQIAEMVRLLTQARIENWLGESVGSWHWWVLFGVSTLPWLFWIKHADRRQIHELTLFGVLMILGALTLDQLGYELSLWSYPFSFIPIFPHLASADYTVLPVVYMLVYQYYPTWRSFFWVSVGIAFAFSFLAEPLLSKLGFYVLIKWAYWASFIIYIPLGLSARWITKLLMDTARKARVSKGVSKGRGY